MGRRFTSTTPADVLTDGNVTLRVGYSGQFSSGGATHGATLKFTRSF